MPCSDSSGGLCWMRPRGWWLGLAASPPAEMFYKGGQKGGSGVSAQPGTAQHSGGKGGSAKNQAHGETRSPFPPLHVPSAHRASRQTLLSQGLLTPRHVTGLPRGGEGGPEPTVKCLQLGLGVSPQLRPCHRWPWEKHLAALCPLSPSAKVSFVPISP